MGKFRLLLPRKGISLDVTLRGTLEMSAGVYLLPRLHYCTQIGGLLPCPTWAAECRETDGCLVGRLKGIARYLNAHIIESFVIMVKFRDGKWR